MTERTNEEIDLEYPRLYGNLFSRKQSFYDTVREVDRIFKGLRVVENENR